MVLQSSPVVVNNLFCQQHKKDKTKMSNENLGLNWAKIGIKSGGLIDKTETIRLISEDLDNWCKANELPAEVIKQACAQVFEKMMMLDSSNTSLKMKDLVLRAIKIIDPAEGTESRVQSMIEDYIRSESAEFEATCGQSGAYHSGRGRTAAVHISNEEYVNKYAATHSLE
jgi:hypothetical protein